MPLIVQKYGGTSLSEQEQVNRVARQIGAARDRDNQIIAVVSAPGSLTNELVSRFSKLTPDSDKREQDMLLSVGEQISIARLAMALQELGYPAVSLTGVQAGILTNEDHGRARILDIQVRRIQRELAAGKVVVVAGYQGISRTGEITTLGRGGSDTSAVALAAAMQAHRCEIWTDVDGVYSSHPAMVPDAPIISRLSFEEMLEMSESGAGVIQPLAVEMAKRHNIEIEVGSSLTGRLGSRVCNRPMEKNRVTAVTLEEAIVRLTLTRTDAERNFHLINTLAQRGIAVKSIWQRGTECGLIIPRRDLAELLFIIENQMDGDIHVDQNHHLALLSVVGAGINFGTDVMGRILAVVAQLRIRPEHYFFTEMRVSFAIADHRATAAVRAIHEALVRGGDLAPAA